MYTPPIYSNDRSFNTVNQGPYSTATTLPAFQSIMIGMEILQAYTAVLAYARVSLLILMYSPKYTVLAARNERAAVFRSLADSWATLPATCKYFRDSDNSYWKF